MKIIEAMKAVKDLSRKADDIADKVHTYCADHSHETARYGERQAEQITEWTQAHSDLIKEIARLKIAIQRTNLDTMVTIELGGVKVTKCIAEWVLRRRELAEKQREMWRRMNDRNLQEGFVTNSTGEKTMVKIRRYYDPRKRDVMVEMYHSEPSKIDGTLEVVNAVTEVVS